MRLDGVSMLIDKDLMESNPDTDLPYGLEKYPRLKLHQKITGPTFLKNYIRMKTSRMPRLSKVQCI